MLQRRILLVLTTFLFLVAARQRAVQHPVAGWPLPEPPRDAFTYSNTAEVRVDHIALDLTVDFERSMLHGSATLHLDNRTATRRLILDTFDLDIERVRLDDGADATWSVGAGNAYGQPLEIAIEPGTESVTIEYATGSGEGLWWNRAEQSYGRKQPYLYTQNEPVEGRSWIPMQDTPSARVTYEAVIHAPRGLLALMSAIDNPRVANDTGVYRFNMPYRIPPYLIALAVGRLEFMPLDGRSGVYAEPELMADAVWELSYIPAMMAAAERIAGRYPFERYDVLLMPPTYIAGGMEHPMLNFINPFSVVSGNRPASPEPKSVIAHELAHSWAGDSATLATWKDIWINEGITSYLTHRILEEVDGVERAEYGWFNDRRSYTAYAQQNADTILHRPEPLDPFSGFGATGYVKGALFMRMLEDHLGRETLDRFLRRYFQVFAFRWVDDVNFLALLREVAIRGDAELEAELDLDEWLYQRGLPVNLVSGTSSAVYDRSLQRAQAFAGGAHISTLAPATWTNLELEVFLALTAPGVLRSRMVEMDAALQLSSRTTPPFTWLIRSIEAGYEPGLVAVERALMRGGPNSWIPSLYQALVNNGHTERAQSIFAQARRRYLQNIETFVDGLLQNAQGAKEKQAA